MTPDDPRILILDASAHVSLPQPALDDPATDPEGEPTGKSASDRGEPSEEKAPDPHHPSLRSSSVAESAPGEAAERERCRALAKTGLRCTNRALTDGEGLCFAHSERRAAERAEARSRGGRTTATMKKGTQRVRFRTPEDVKKTLERAACEMVAGRLSPAAYSALVRAAELVVRPNPGAGYAPLLGGTRRTRV